MHSNPNNQIHVFSFPVNKISPRPSLVPESAESQSIHNVSSQSSLATQDKPPEKPAEKPKVEPGKPPSRTGACRVCLKSFKPDDFSKTCFECKQRVCEDCASYSKMDSSEDLVSRANKIPKISLHCLF